MGINKPSALTIAGAISGVLSIMGSTAIIYNVLSRNPKTRFETTYHRMMFAMSVMDIIASLSGCLSTLPAPSDTPGVYAFGNTATCTAQGFFTLLSGTSVIFYNFFLTIHYLLTICYNFSEYRIRKKIEPYFHLIALGYPLCTSLTGLILKTFNYAGHRCWIAAYPTGCVNNDSVECTRGIHETVFRWISIGWLVSFTIIAMPILMIFIVWTVWTREVEMRNKYRFASTDKENPSVWVSCWCCTKTKKSSPQDEYGSQQKLLTRTKAVATQCALYMSAFMLTYIWSFTLRILETAGKGPFFLQVLASIFFPLQGFLYYLVFIKRQASRLRKNFPEYTLLQAYVEATIHPAKCDLKTRRYSLSRLSTIHQTDRQSAHLLNAFSSRKALMETRAKLIQECQGEGTHSESADLDEELGGKVSKTHSITLDDLEILPSCVRFEEEKCDDCQSVTANNEILRSTDIIDDSYCMNEDNKFEVVQNRALKIEEYDVTPGDNNNAL